MSSPLLFAARLLGPLLALSFCASALLAQKPAPTPAAPPQSLLFFVMPFPGSDLLTDQQLAKLPSALAFSYLVEGKPVELMLPVGGLTEPLLRPSAANFSLRRPLTVKPGERPPPAAEIAEVANVTFPADWKSVLILVSAPTDGSSAKLLAYNTSESVLPPAQLGLYNLTGQPLAARLGSTQTMVKAKSLTLLPIQLPPNRDNASMELNLALPTSDGGWKLAARQSLVLGKLKRRLAIVTGGGAGNEGTVNLMHFRLPPDPVTPPPPGPDTASTAAR